MDGLQTRYAGRLQVIRLNFNDRQNEKAISALGIRAHPTIAIIRADGTLSRLWLGAPKEGDLEPLIDAVLP